MKLARTPRSLYCLFKITVLSATLLSASTAVIAQSTNPQYLAANCANCHGTQGNAQGAMPGLAGLKEDYIIEQMKAFKEGKRPASIMHQLAKGYTDEQVRLIASYFASQKAQ